MTIVHEASVWFGVIMPDRVPDETLKALCIQRSDKDSRDWVKARDELESCLQGDLQCITWGDCWTGRDVGFGIAVRSEVRKVEEGAPVSWPDGRPTYPALRKALKRLGITARPSWYLTMEVR